MEQSELVAISDFHKLAVLDLHRIKPIRADYAGRYWAYYSRDDAGKLLDDYETGRLKVVARDFVSAINRTKDKIFELERARENNGARNYEIPQHG